jgi:hypothetical protein
MIPRVLVHAYGTVEVRTVGDLRRWCEDYPDSQPVTLSGKPLCVDTEVLVLEDGSECKPAEYRRMTREGA